MFVSHVMLPIGLCSSGCGSADSALRNTACVFASMRPPGHVNWYLQEFEVLERTSNGVQSARRPGM